MTSSPWRAPVRAASSSIAGAGPSSSSAAGRSSRISVRSPSISPSIVPTTSSSAARIALGVVAPARGGDEHPQAAEALQRLVVQLARPARALGLRAGDRLAQPLRLDRAGGGDRRRGAGGEGQQQLLVLVRGVAADGGQQAERAAAEGQRDEHLRLEPVPGERGADRVASPAASRVPRNPGEISPAVAATTRPGSSASRITIPRAPTSARPRLTISSSTRSRSVSPPIARAIAVVASSRRTDASSSSRRRSEAW